MKNIAKVIRDPSSAFETPHDVVLDKNLNREQKIQILRSWEYDARELEVAEEESMISNQPDLLRRVKKALSELDASGDPDDAPPTKQGGK